MKRTIFISLLIASLTFDIAFAESCHPDGFGGYFCTNGSSAHPDGAGGYIINNGSTVRPDGAGGYQIIDGGNTVQRHPTPPAQQEAIRGYRNYEGQRCGMDPNRGWICE